jgi:hypothetical protein
MAYSSPMLILSSLRKEKTSLYEETYYILFIKFKHFIRHGKSRPTRRGSCLKPGRPDEKKSRFTELIKLDYVNVLREGVLESIDDWPYSASVGKADPACFVTLGSG